MDLKPLLNDPQACPSVIWTALRKTYGLGVGVWEPDTFRVELRRRGVEVTDGLMAKILGAQTVATTDTWATRHDVFFAFALACDGVPAASDAHTHPTYEQLCWAVREIEAISGRAVTNEEGVDPDEIDPAVSVVMMDDGLVVAPDELAFAEDVLARLTPDHDELRAQAKAAWAPLKALEPEALRAKLEGLDDTALNVQLARLGDARLYVAARVGLRSTQHDLLHHPGV